MTRDFFRAAWLVMRKDLTVESRSWEMASTTLLFAVSCVLVFAFAFVRAGRPVAGAAAGILWIAVAFSGALALGPAFERERRHDALRGLLLAPVERSAIFVGKLLGVLLLMTAVEAVVLLLVALLFQAPLAAAGWRVGLLLLLGNVGFGTVGTLFAAMLARTRSRAVLLPILLYPVALPALIAGVMGTAALFQPEPNFDLARFWTALLLCFDVVFLVLALWTFEPVMTE